MTRKEISDLSNTDPSLLSHNIDLSNFGGVGTIYQIQVSAYNMAGFVYSNMLSVALASLPSKPLNPPISVSSITN
jgi:hypothetical protein